MRIFKMRYKIPLGYDLLLHQTEGIKIPLSAPLGHLIVVGGSGSGKSTALLYWLAKMKKKIFLLNYILWILRHLMNLWGLQIIMLNFKRAMRR